MAYGLTDYLPLSDIMMEDHWYLGGLIFQPQRLPGFEPRGFLMINKEASTI